MAVDHDGVYPVMRITGMDKNLVVLLGPVVETIPVERDVGELGRPNTHIAAQMYRGHV
jgi:hypothetical protein